MQGWAQQSLSPGSAAAEVPSDQLVEVLRQLGARDGEVASSDRLAEDLHLDSLALVQLQSTLETRFGVELDDAVWGQVRTVGDLRALLRPPAAGTAGIGARESMMPVSPARLPESGPAIARAPQAGRWSRFS